MSQPGTDIFQRKGGWPYPGTKPPISTLADIFTKTDAESSALRLGFAAWLFERGTAVQNEAYNHCLVNPSEVESMSVDIADAIEEHFTDYFWASELPKYRVQMSATGEVATPTLGGQVEVKLPMRYWSDDLQSYATDDAPSKYVPADGAQPRLNYDRYYNQQTENWEYITGINPVQTAEEILPDFDTVRYWSADLTSYTTMANMTKYVPAGDIRPRLNHDRYYDDKDGNWAFITGFDAEGKPLLGDMPTAQRILVKPQDASHLIANLAAIKKAVAYTAVRAKRRKELLADRPARKLIAEAMSKKGGLAELIGEQFSMKGAASIVAKSIEDSMKEVGAQSLLDAVEKISDGVRYTIMIPRETYTDGVLGYLAFFKENRWVNTKFANNWTKPLPSGYRGVNTKWEVSLTIDNHPAKEIVEVQFHTRESYDAKEDMTHQIKEEIRLLGNAIAEDEKRLAMLDASTTEHAALAQKIATDKVELQRKEEVQRGIFEEMARKFAPPGVDAIRI